MDFSAVSIGTFDGFHVGHQHLLKQLVSVSGRYGLKSIVVALSSPAKPVAGLLTTPQEKLELLRRLPIDEVLMLPSEKGVLDQAAKTFFEKFLIEKLKMRCLVVGEGFAMGKGRKGNLPWLQNAGMDTGVEIIAVKPMEISGETVSSSKIRELIKEGNVFAASRLLGRFYSAQGKPEAGNRLGRKLGHPTINISVGRGKMLPMGVYTVLVAYESSKDRLWPGVANVGTRPTVSSSGEVKIEVNLIDFSGEWKRKNTKVYFCERMRSERKFRSLDALKSQISSDVVQARNYFVI